MESPNSLTGLSNKQTCRKPELWQDDADPAYRRIPSVLKLASKVS